MPTEEITELTSEYFMATGRLVLRSRLNLNMPFAVRSPTMIAIGILIMLISRLYLKKMSTSKKKMAPQKRGPSVCVKGDTVSKSGPCLSLTYNIRV